MSRNVAIATAIVVAVLLVLFGFRSVQRGAEASPGTTERVSVDSLENQANDFNCCSDISADGRFVTFRSSASNLVPGDTNAASDIFVRDRLLGTTERVSVSSAGLEGNAGSFLPAINGDGRFVVFLSDATNLDTDAMPFVRDVFVRDRIAGTTDLVSINVDREQFSTPSGAADISADGSYVVFQNGQIYVRDQQRRRTELASVTSTGEPANNAAYTPAISGDGRYVAFYSPATNFVPGDSNSRADIFLRDRVAGTTEIASLDSNEAQGTQESSEPDISSDGRFVSFGSFHPFVPGDSNAQGDIFLRDRQAGSTERVSVANAGAQANSTSSDAAISTDGRFATFQSSANNLVPGDTNGDADIFLRDRQAGTTVRVNVSSTGAEANCGHTFSDPKVSGNGQLVSFTSCATNLVPADTNGFQDIFMHDTAGIPPTPTATPNVTPTPGPVYAVNSVADAPDINAGDGVCFTTSAECTLRAAIQESNTHPGTDTINFSITSGQLNPRISPNTPLPAITDSVTIDATTQPEYDGTPRVQLDGQNAGAGADGLVINAPNSTVKALSITSFGGDGMELTAGGSIVQNNDIGVRPDGLQLGNSAHGIHIGSSGNTLTGNRIWSNGGDGAFVASGAGNRVTNNKIWNNAGLGIDLAPDGVTPNDLQDPDSGPNDLQNFPVLTSAVRTGDIVPAPFDVSGSLNSTPNTTFTLEFFSNQTICNQSQLVEGEGLLGSANVTTNGSGFIAFQVRFMIGPGTPPSVTVTASNPAGSTSEFSACIASNFPGQPTPTPTATASPTATATRTATATATASPTATPTPSPAPTTPPDTDTDGWSDSAEGVIGTNPLAGCGTDAWPPDINNDTFSDITDVASLTGVFGQSVPPAPARYDIAPEEPDGFVDITDISRMTGLFGQSCAP